MLNNLRKKNRPQSNESAYSAGRLFKTVNTGLCLFIVVIVFLLMHFDLLNRFEMSTLDLRFKLRGRLPVDKQITLINIDESSIKSIGRWPWSREWFASIITTLSEQKTKIIAFDIFFSEPSPLIDFFLIEATRMAKNVFFSLAFESEDVKTPQEQTDSPTISLIERFKFPESQIIGNKENIPKYNKAVPPLAELYNSAFGAGHVVVIPDKDGAIRQSPALINCSGEYFLQFGIEIAAADLGISRDKIKIILGKYIDFGLTPKGNIKIPIDKKGFFIINWAAPWGKDFRFLSYCDIISAYQKKLKGEDTGINLDELKDSICLIGLTAIGLIDIKPMPLEPAYPIVGMHANIINSIFENRFLRKTDPPVDLCIILLMSALVGFLIPKFRPIGGTLLTIGIIAAYFFFALLLFKLFGLIVSVIYPLATVLLCFISVTTHTEVANAVERVRLYHLAVEDGLTKLYVVRHFKELLSQEMAKAARYNRPLSIIISDIDHFKRINDTYGHLAGDFILREIANIFKTSCRETDTAGRYGGEEFTIMLTETERNGAVEFAERLRKLLEGLTLEYNNIKFNITVSFGVAEFKGDATPADLIKRADEALYVAKETGRNKVCFS